MSDKMREAFEKWYMTNTFAHVDHLSTFYNDLNCYSTPIANNCWKAWQAAQSAAVPVVGDVDKMAESISGMVMEWVTAASAHNGDWQSGLARIIRKRIERFQPTTSITAAELERLQQCEDVLRSLACSLSAGGYNADVVDPAVFEKKIRDGIDMLIAPLTAELDALRKDAAAGRVFREQLPNTYIQFLPEIDAAIAAEGRRNENRP